MDDLIWLMEWYASHCDGNWEHQYGITIQTLDNPGWRLAIDLNGCGLETRPFAKLDHGMPSDVSWWTCSVTGGKFLAHCGKRDLPIIIAAFRKWATD
jgi:hypothetical protein